MEKENEDGSILRSITSNLFKIGDRVVYVSDPRIIDHIIKATKDINARLNITADVAPYYKLKYAEGTVVFFHYFTDYSFPGRVRTRFFYTVVFDDPDVNFMMLSPIQILEEDQLVPVMTLTLPDVPEGKTDDKKDDTPAIDSEMP